MGAGVSKEIIARESSVAVKNFVAKLVALDASMSGFVRRGASAKNRVDGILVEIDMKIIRASNGEVAGWPVARVSKGAGGESDAAASVFYSPPWLEGGCSPEAVINAFNHMKGGSS